QPPLARGKARQIVAARFAAGERRLRAALQDPAEVAFADSPDPFVNINAPADLAAAAARLGAAA
ncbi:MAG: hypothetical protein IE922_03575, partial [Sphingomonadales bacterium]|nr:hypothetical protein [Sphingomonadales bacterium]